MDFQFPVSSDNSGRKGAFLANNWRFKLTFVGSAHDFQIQFLIYVPINLCIANNERVSK